MVNSFLSFISAILQIGATMQSTSAIGFSTMNTFCLDQSPTTTKNFSLTLAPRYSGVQNIIQNTKTKPTLSPDFRLDQSPTTTKNFFPPRAPRYRGVQNTIQNTKQTIIQLTIQQKAIGSLRISPKFLTLQHLRIPRITIERP